MPTYEYDCDACNKTFTVHLTIAEHEKNPCSGMSILRQQERHPADIWRNCHNLQEKLIDTSATLIRSKVCSLLG